MRCMLPAQQDFCANNASRLKLDLRLVHQEHFAAFHRPAKIALEAEPFDRPRSHVLRIELVPVAA